MTFLTHLEDSTLQRLVAGELVEAEASAARAHLEECGPCRRRASTVSSLFALLAQPPSLPQPPVDFLAAVMARVEREAPSPVLVTRAMAVRGIAAGVTAIGAGVALLVSGGAGAHVPAVASEFASRLASVAGHAGLAMTVLKAGAPVLGAAAAAPLALLAPLFWKTLQSIQPNAHRATVRT